MSISDLNDDLNERFVAVAGREEFVTVEQGEMRLQQR